jgi:hypothetical protein
VALLESEEVAGFVVGLAVGPATPKDADPFEGQGADGRIVGAALGTLARRFRTMGRLLADPCWMSGRHVLETTVDRNPRFCTQRAWEDRGVHEPADRVART